MSLRRNLIANFAGQGWTVAIGIVFIPLYIEYLGIEAYGLIGVFAIFQAWLALLDMGLTPTLNREMARFSAGGHSAQSIHDLLRSLEIVCLTLAVLVGLSVLGGSSWLALNWFNTDKLPKETIAHAVSIMAMVLALRLVEGVYRGAILGLQRHVHFNMVNSLLATFRAVGAVGILAWVSPTIEAYFLWQGLSSIAAVGVLMYVTHASLPVAPERPRFSWRALGEIRRFVGGMMLTTFLALLLTQVDKILLSRLLSLEAFAYYTLAATLAAGVVLLITPVAQSAYPRFSELVERGDMKLLAATYHRSAQLVTALAAPGALILVFFGQSLLVLWTQDTTLAQHVAPVLALLALGTLFNGLMHVPHMLQLAHGWPGFAARVNLVAVTVLVPSIFWVTPRFGPLGAAFVWVVLNAGYVLIGVHFMYRRLLPDEKWPWYRNDVALPLGAVLAVMVGGKLTSPGPASPSLEAFWIVLTGTLGLCAALATIDRKQVAIF